MAVWKHCLLSSVVFCDELGKERGRDSFWVPVSRVFPLPPLSWHGWLSIQTGARVACRCGSPAPELWASAWAWQHLVKWIRETELFILLPHPAVRIKFLLLFWGILPVFSVIDFLALWGVCVCVCAYELCLFKHSLLLGIGISIKHMCVALGKAEVSLFIVQDARFSFQVTRIYWLMNYEEGSSII